MKKVFVSIYYFFSIILIYILLVVRDEFTELRYHPPESEKRFCSRNQNGFEPKNRDFNRYRDIIPYDHTRVKLDHCNYINASWIGKDKTYIATQGTTVYIHTCIPVFKLIYISRSEGEDSPTFLGIGSPTRSRNNCNVM